MHRIFPKNAHAQSQSPQPLSIFPNELDNSRGSSVNSSKGVVESVALGNTPSIGNFTNDNTPPPLNRSKKIPLIVNDDESDSEERIQRQKTQYQPLSIRYNICFSILHFSIWRFTILFEQILAILLIIYLISSAQKSSIIWIFYPIFLIFSYFVQSLILYKVIFNKYQSKYSDVKKIHFTLCYILCCIPSCFITDIYVTFVLWNSDLSESRYMSRYFDVKYISWTLFSSLPMLITSICIHQQIHFLFVISFCFTFFYHLFSIILQLKTNNLSIKTHIKRYYLLKDVILPYKVAIVSNRITSLKIREPLTHIEWRKFVGILEDNVSIKTVDISFQIIPHNLFQILFKSLVTNNLCQIDLTDCNIFAPFAELKKKKKRISALSLLDDDMNDPDLEATRPTMTKFEDRMAEVREIRQVRVALMELFGVGTLRVITMPGNCVCGELDVIINGVILNKKLRELYLSNNSLYVSGLTEESMTRLFQNCPNLQTLDLSNNGLDDENMNILITSLTCLAQKRNVETARFYLSDWNYLDLSNNKIEKIAPIFKFAKIHDIEVSMEGNDIENEEVIRMTSVFGANDLMDSMIGT